ncbi:MAG TPA: glycosyltransferase family 4 protein [Pirellulales bacterium]|jgi:glycosyltransferase involved in cell wall biosynthesis|nr:glycosyltransferase family 4 protein [Pirellulales bacterium]
MLLLIHDYAGHPFQVQLSRSLARRGHRVVHAYCGSTLTPRGTLAATAAEEGRLSVESLDLGEQIEKHSLLRRRAQEARYGHLFERLIDRLTPDLVVSGNTPSEPQRRAARFCARRGTPFISWVQDIYGIAAQKILQKKFGLPGRMIGNYFIRLDKQALQLSDAVVVITEDFFPTLRNWGLPAERVHNVPNWAPLEECEMRPKDNSWSRQHGLQDTLVFLYSGTLGMKHNPGLLLQLAQKVQCRADTRVVVISEGAASDWLRQEKERLGLTNLMLMKFQPFDVLPNVLGAADVLLAILERDAGAFSVPSKVLTYLCAGRPLLLSVPPENLAARIVQTQAAGLVVAPEDEGQFADAALAYLDDDNMRAEFGANARRYAEEHFDIEAITDRFEFVFEMAQSSRRRVVDRLAKLATLST